MRVTAQFPQLRCEVDDSSGPVDYSAELPAQPGLSFPVGITLDGDVMQLYAGDVYHQDFFPACDAAVVSEVEAYLGVCFQASAGLLSSIAAVALLTPHAWSSASIDRGWFGRVGLVHTYHSSAVPHEHFITSNQVMQLPLRRVQPKVRMINARSFQTKLGLVSAG